MEYTFIPKQLISAKEEVVLKHKKAPEAVFESLSNEDEALINKLSALKKWMLKANALALNEKQLVAVAGYIPYNYLSVPMSNLFEVMRLRSDESSCKALFEQWQEAFDNQECNDFLKVFAATNAAFKDVLESNHLTVSLFLKVIGNDNIPLALVEHLNSADEPEEDDFYEKLKYYGVKPNSWLEIECMRTMMIFCSRAEYLDCSDQNILDIIKSYDGHMLKMFLGNFVMLLSLRELQTYPKVAGYLSSYIGYNNSETYTEFFKETDSGIIGKYNDWMNVYKLNLYFDQDERSRFWKKYKILSVVKHSVSNCVVIEFPEYAAVEMLDRRDPSYVFKKDAFNKIVYPKLDVTNGDDMRKVLKANKEECAEFQEKRGQWQAKLSANLIKKRITERINLSER